MSNRFDPGDRTYHLSDERMEAFKALSLADRLRWVEELATFLRLARTSRERARDSDPVGDSRD